MRNHRPAAHHWQTLSYNDEYDEKPPTCHKSLTNFIIWETTDLPHITDKLYHIMMSIMRNHRSATHHWQTLSYNDEYYEKPLTCHTSLTNFIIWETTHLPHISDKLYHIMMSIMRNHRPATHHWQTLSHNDEYDEKPPTCHTSLTNFII